jgi:hypothetical protein
LINPGLYGSLAGVAAITTALQAAVALQPLSALTDTRQRKRRTGKGQIDYNNARSDAKKAAWTALWLNIPGIAVNAAVLLSWWRVAVAKPKVGQWEYWLPWAAVAAASAFLLAVAIVTMVKLRNVGQE